MHFLSQAQAKEVRELFAFLDTDRDGLLDRKLTRMRPGSLGICASIKHKYDVDTVPHVLCGGFTKEETEYLLVDCHYLGIDNVMALRGDAMRVSPHLYNDESDIAALAEAILAA